MTKYQIAVFVGSIIWVFVFLAVVRFVQVASKCDKDEEQ